MQFLKVHTINLFVFGTGPSHQEKLRTAGIDVQKKLSDELENINDGFLKYNEVIGLCSKKDGIDHNAEKIKMTQQIEKLTATLEKVQDLAATKDCKTLIVYVLKQVDLLDIF